MMGGSHIVTTSVGMCDVDLRNAHFLILFIFKTIMIFENIIFLLAFNHHFFLQFLIFYTYPLITFKWHLMELFFFSLKGHYCNNIDDSSLILYSSF